MTPPNSLPPDVSICICTYKRPELLRVLLQSLANQNLGPHTAEVVVVDNDPAASAKAILEQAKQWLPLPLSALHCSTPNIALARNTAVQGARGIWVQFLDDDEEPDPEWLLKLMQTQQQYQADAVFGPVLSRYSPDVPLWMQKAGFFDRPRYPTGTPMPVGDTRTGNVLVRRSLLLSLPGPFEEAYGRTGGEDTRLFGQLMERGAKLVWCDEATVQEDVPSERATLQWVLQRAFRGGQSFVRTEQQRRQGLSRISNGLYLGSRALAQLLVASGLALLSFPLGREHSSRWLRTVAAQLGKITGLLGHRYEEYRP